MRKLILALFALILAGSVAMAKTYPKTFVVDLSAADTTDFYFSGTTNSARSLPAPSNSGWSLWVMNSVTMDCDDVDVVVWPMDEEGNVSTNSANSVTLWTALDLSDSTTVEHTAVGTIDRCAGLKIIVTPTNGSGIARFKLFYDAE